RLALANCARTGEVAVPAETEYAKNGRGQSPSRYRDHYCPGGVRLKLREHSSHERDRGGHGGGDEASEHLSRERPESLPERHCGLGFASSGGTARTGTARTGEVAVPAESEHAKTGRG